MKIILRELSSSLQSIDSCELPGKHKVWCYNFALYPRIMWPLKLSNITSAAVGRMEAKANTFIRKWLGLPRCFSAAGLYRKSITLGYRQEKAQLVQELRESSDVAVKDQHARVVTGRKWRAEVQQAVSRLQHREVMGLV